MSMYRRQIGPITVCEVVKKVVVKDSDLQRSNLEQLKFDLGAERLAHEQQMHGWMICSESIRVKV